MLAQELLDEFLIACAVAPLISSPTPIVRRSISNIVLAAI
jgi:hypothetical protein